MNKIAFVPLTQTPTPSSSAGRDRSWYEQLRWQPQLEVPVSLIAHRFTFTAVFQTRTVDGRTEAEAIARDAHGREITPIWGLGRDAHEAIADLADMAHRLFDRWDIGRDYTSLV